MRTFSTRMSQGILSLTALLVTLFGGFTAQAREPLPLTRVIVSVENLAPVQGTFQTPFWVAFHNGEFDIYDRDNPASSFFPDNPDALERLAEDGITREDARLW